jgi:hypothetical protein
MKSRRPVNSAVMRRASFVEMTELQPHETTVTGNWLIDGTTVIGDDACRRIEWLVDTQLERLATGSSGWETLYRDPRDGRLWERTYPHGEVQGGGPPQLSIVSAEDVLLKYRVGAA